MVDVFIVAIIFYFAYRIFDSLIHRKERLIIAQKLETLSTDKNGVDLNKWIGAPEVNKFAPLRWGLLVVGAALGMFVGFILDWTMELNYNESQIVYLSLVLLFGGIGLLVSFMMERKYSAHM